jgi:hypothetical protein
LRLDYCGRIIAVGLLWSEGIAGFRVKPVDAFGGEANREAALLGGVADASEGLVGREQEPENLGILIRGGHPNADQVMHPQMFD